MRQASLIFLIGVSFAAAMEPRQDFLKAVTAIRRVYVDKLNGGDQAQHIRDMIITSLQNSNLFILTENEERADAVIRGSAEDLIFTESHQSSDGVNARTQVSLPGNNSNRTSSRTSLGLTVGDHESQQSTERKHESVATVRLVAKDGDVIWSTTQESQGGKLKGASKDVADKITKKLVDDIEKARKEMANPKPEPISVVKPIR